MSAVPHVTPSAPKNQHLDTRHSTTHCGSVDVVHNDMARRRRRSRCLTTAPPTPPISDTCAGTTASVSRACLPTSRPCEIAIWSDLARSGCATMHAYLPPTSHLSAAESANSLGAPLAK